MGSTSANESTPPSCPDCHANLYSGENHDCTKSIHEPNLGRLISGRYQIGELLGTGGMGHVYTATDLILGREVALKLMHKYLLSRPNAVQRFQQEAKAASAVHALNVVSVFDFGLTEEGEPFIVMERITGTSLSQLLEGRALTWKHAVEIALGACEGLKVAHASKVIHRDIKPSNIIVCRNKEGEEIVKVVDFGIAKLLSDDGDDAIKLTKTGDVFGSPLYMSPEQCAGRTLDARSDIYSLGCVLYEAIVGQPPIQGVNSLETMQNHLNKQPAELRTLLEIPDALNNCVNRSLAKRPEYRYQSIVEFESDLKRALESNQIALTSPGLRKRFAEKTPWNLIVSCAVVIVAFGSVAYLTNMNPIALIAIALVLLLSFTAGFTLLFGTWANDMNQWSYIPAHLKGKHKLLATALADCGSGDGLPLGMLELPKLELLLFPFRQRILGLTTELRKANGHVLVAGLPGTGKSHFLATLIESDLALERRSVFVVDTNGILTDLIRAKFSGRCLIVDPMHSTTCGIDPFEVYLGEDLSAAAGSLVKALSIDTSLSEHTENVLRDAIWLLMATRRTFDDLPNLLFDRQFRDMVCEELNSKALGTRLDLTRLRNKWEQHGRDSLETDWSNTIDPCLDLFASLASQERIRAILSRASTRLNLLECHHSRSLVVIKLPAKLFGRSANTLNNIFMARLIGALLSDRSAGREHPCSLYVDGAEGVINLELLQELTSIPDLALSISLTGLQNLPDDWITMAKSRFGTICAFNLSKEDASILAPLMFPVHGQRVYVSPSTWGEQRIKVVTDEVEISKQRLTTLEPRSFFAYLSGTSAGLFRLRSKEFSADLPVALEP